jgi:ribonuclease T2
MKILTKYLFLLIALFFCLTVWTDSARAIVEFEGRFTVMKTCPALQSIANNTNPKNIQAIAGSSYSVKGKNKELATHYLINIADTERWVSVKCGNLTKTDDMIGSQGKEYLLALSWQPSFCETHRGKLECKNRTEENFEASNIALHGLWPQPRNNIYCNVDDRIKQLDMDKKWSEMPSIELSNNTLSQLKIKMPGVASDLHLHEWYKHGTCYSNSPEEYYQESIALLDEVNNSQVRDLFTTNLGESVTSTEIRQAFDNSFGENAGSKVQVKCQQDDNEDRRMVAELQISLKGTIEPDTPISSLLKSGKTVAAGCNIGEVDLIGIDQ